MSESQDALVEQSQSSGQEQEGSLDKGDTVTREAFERLLGQKKKGDQQLRELSEKLKAKEEEDLRKKEDYVTLLKNREEEVNQLRSKLEDQTRANQNMLKIGAVLKNLPGEVKESYWGILPIDQVELNDDGMPEETSVKRISDYIMSNYPEIVSQKAKGPEIPAKAAVSAASAKDQRQELINKFARLKF